MKRHGFAKAVFILILLLTISCCEHDQSQSAEPLIIEDIRFDNSKASAIKQIVFEFNQDIAILGAVPTVQQIAAIRMPNHLRQQCTWRFINLDKLACEVTGQLSFFTQYNIEINTAFQALGQKLSNKKSVVVSTGVPSIDIHIGGSLATFPTEIKINNFSTTDIPLAAFNQFLKLKQPDGTYLNLDVIQSKKPYQKDSLYVSLRDDVTNLPDGYYQLVFMPGFKGRHSLSQSNQPPLYQETMIEKFWYSRSFQFLGFACREGNYPQYYKDITLDKSNKLNCPPEKVGLAFSNRLKDNSSQIYRQSAKVDWLNGPSYQVNYSNNEKRKFYVSLNLSGHSHYEIHLSKITAITGKKINQPSVITFNTQASTPLWQFEQAFGTVVEADRSKLPKYLRRNVNDLEQHTIAINSAQQLQLFLNNRIDKPIVESLPSLPSTKNWLNEQIIDFRKHLQTNSGMAYVKLLGTSQTEDGLYAGKSHVAQQQKGLMLQSVDYNLALWHDNDLLLQAIDWQAKPINNLDVSLVCANQKAPKNLGMTDDKGILWLTPEYWQHSLSERLNNTCWLWTEKGNKQAAIKLHDTKGLTQRVIKKDINAFAWTAQPIYQPSDVVHIGFIARKRSENGLVPVHDLSNYRVLLRHPKTSETTPINLKSLTNKGFSSAQITLPSLAALGRYSVILQNITTKQEQSIGNFSVLEFIPPEFEFAVKTPADININETVHAQISAHRMNGVALKHAKANINMRLSRSYSSPKSWPEEYQFTSWQDFENHSGINENNSFKPQQVKLDALGKYQFESASLQSKVPLGELTLTTEITADDGEVQTKNTRLHYFSREHYIGTRFDKKTRELEVIAINKLGKELNDIPVTIQVFERDAHHRNSPKGNKQSVMQCTLIRLPNSCKVTVEVNALVNIKSGSQEYQWIRSHNFKSQERPKPVKLTQTFKLTTEQENISSGDTLKLSLNSTVAGIGTFILQAGKVQKVWQQAVMKGENEFELKVDSRWVPYARIYASLAVDRAQALKMFTQALQNQTSNRSAKKSVFVPPLTRASTEKILGEQRLLTSDIQVLVTPKEINPKVAIHLVHDNSIDGNVDSNNLNSKSFTSSKVVPNEVIAGSEVTLSIQSNVEAESQIWLVNEALLNLMRTKEQDFDYYQKLMSRWAFEQELQFEALTQRLIVDVQQTLEGLNQKSKSLAFSGDIASVGKRHSEQNNEFAQSVWLKTVSLEANQSKNISVQLPQLIGRWKVLALTATDQTMSIDSTSINTVKDVEYFIDAPRAMLNSDSAHVAITQINRTGDSVTDSLTLWINGQRISSFDVQLAAHDYKRMNIALPLMDVGKHTLKLTSELQPTFSAVNVIHVLESAVAKTRTWLVNGNSKQIYGFQSPAHYVADSLNISVMNAGEQMPDWLALSDYTKEYPHKCWEQTVSRAVSYQFNPLAKQQWPEGEKALNHLINTNEGLRYSMFSYFPNMEIDFFLTAYTYLASAWLADTNTPLNVDKNKIKNSMLAILKPSDTSNFYMKTDARAKSMALLALAVNRDIDLNTLLTLRQTIGASNSQSALLQALALKELGADSTLYSDTLRELTNHQYTDDTPSVFNSSSEKCLAALVYHEDTQSKEALSTEVINTQHGQGHFGSTFANAICAYALKDSPRASLTEYEAVEHQKIPQNNSQSHDSDSMQYQVNKQDHWLKLNYRQALEDVTAESSGISLQKRLSIKRGDKWLDINKHTTLEVGELVKTTIVIDSPKQREHIAITDGIAGGLEAINMNLEGAHVAYTKHFGRNWRENNNFEIRDGKAYWYIRHLNKGKYEVFYFGRVRHVGEFSVSPAKVEAMYRPDVFANTEADMLVIK